MKKFKIEENFLSPEGFSFKDSYRALFDHSFVDPAFNWASVGLQNLFGHYYLKKRNEKEAQVCILKVLACATED